MSLLVQFCDKTMQLTLVLAIAFMLRDASTSAHELNEDVESGVQQAWHRVQANVEQVRDELDSLKKEEALQKFKKILGIHSRQSEQHREELPPQFMTELYNTVTNSEGKTRRRNPFNAKIVRSFIEKDTSSSNVYLFNISDLDESEAMLEAELHLYRRRSSPESMHPSVLTSPHYLIKVYQILADRNINEPDLHRLLNVHYVGAYASGWQVFNVKQAVLSWLSNSANLGLLVIATTIFGDRVTVDFSRRGDESHNKQPILVLFNDDRVNDQPLLLDEDEEEDELDEALIERKKRQIDGQLELVPEYDEEERPIYFRREKKSRGPKLRDENAIEIPRGHTGIVSRRRSFDQTLTSMDIYQRAMLREKLKSRKKPMHESQQRRRHSETGQRSKREVADSPSQCRKVETEPCSKRELYVNFKEIGLTEIIAPEGYAAYQCSGHCKSPLSQEQKPTNHATIQGIVQKMNLSQNEGVQMPCCVPVSLSSISILYHDNDKDGVVLKSYEDMSVVSCGCR
ncbi:bone morphogenetic protein 4-like [Phymastichus coffea]|uniref:bone morphogenetic protein 4-like n=1 Tax=Phymastichus coffea TaxID=108790 RepID=UPI00273BEA88|nr:bone morphogenetic protein 4-like [Phymastichus coffea]